MFLPSVMLGNLASLISLIAEETGDRVLFPETRVSVFRLLVASSKAQGLLSVGKRAFSFPARSAEVQVEPRGTGTVAGLTVSLTEPDCRGGV